ncbi:GNAT family N-acetyltransferase [Listeria booriae]|uniref:GNAT family N-acetyltransferase n=1 Tax=Listeria booriae TaxID=1552123 RepID=UPI00162A511F|nr:GNAT family N-acetyltransferase [Listeria booriae]MBC1911272.1 GNAT family N-acetyltransferase [Listeria booriae]MBC1985052.1 GNAT family N-acetyltransferase [Listeria booriae]MBC2066498.1 GNAT family N-acetyltransferase [Listeria booriae]MBC2077911.1 GNAT family N-acetyltransferase [Listeria booriae]
MEVTLNRVLKSEDYVLQNLIQFYHYEFSQYVPVLRVNADGLFKKMGIANYWTNPEYHPFFIKVDGALAGFVMIRSNGEFSNVEQFFTLKYYAGQGVGRAAAKQVFDLFPGKWRVLQVKNNYAAQAFWRKVISEYTGNRYFEKYDAKDDRSSVQEFHTDNRML